LGWLRPCPQILRPDWKGFSRANSLAYWALSSVTKEKSFITFPPEFSLRIKEISAGVEPLTVEGEGENASLPSISSNLVSSCPGQNKIARLK
jgi:hypothetical protein